jgi:hypothetical protein
MSSCGWFPLNPKQIGDWLDRHPEALPNSLADIVRLPVAFRRIMVGRVSPEVRVRLWREHLQTFLRSDSPLSETQRELVVSSISRLSELLAAPGPNPGLNEWERQIAAVFSRPEAAHVFGMLGPPEPPEGLPLPPDALPGPAT